MFLILNKASTLKTHFILALTLVCLVSPCYAEPVSKTQSGRETMSKFMLNLARFVTWPDSTFGSEGAPYKYCVMGDDAFGGTLETRMDGKTTKNRQFDLSFLALSNLEAVKTCHVVFINGGTIETLGPVIDELAGLPILTVGEFDNFARYGGMIGFYGKGRKVALAINQKRLESAGLIASSKLYRASTM